MCCWSSLLLLLGFQFWLVLGAPVPNYPPEEMIGFMKSYGYLPNVNGSQAETLYTEEGFRKVIRQVQRFGGLNETGELNNATLALMDQPRCGVPDVLKDEQGGSGNRTKRYIIATPGWRKKHLTYHLSNWSPNLNHHDVSERLRKAFNLWSDITPLRFHPLASPDADLIVSFGRRDHGDDYPFDGPGNTLAHAFFPYQHGPVGGDIHFDSDETWVDNHGNMKPKQGVDFLSVATHEIGHSLGLAHSAEQGSIMFPYYRGDTGSPKLGYDDVLAMYDLYVRQGMFEDGHSQNDDMEVERRRMEWEREKERERNRNRTPAPPAPPRRPPQIPVIPTIPTTPPRDRPRHPVREGTSNPRPTTEQPRRTDERRPVEPDRRDNRPRYPTVTDQDPRRPPPTRTPPKVPERPRDEDRESKDNRTKIPDLCKGRFDAAALLRNELFVFKGKFLWRFKDRGLLMNGYPIRFNTFFRGIPKSVKRIDAIYERPSDHNIVLFSGRQIWSFTGDRFSPGSPKDLTSLGLPSQLDGIDAAFVWSKNGKTYFFKSDRYWRYDDRTKTMDDGYPKEITQSWPGLPTNLDTAITFKDGQTYFFKDRIYWRFDNVLIKTDINFPRSSAEDWVGC